MKKFKLLIPALILFVSGMIMGGIGGFQWYHYRVVTAIENGPEGIRTLFVKRLTRGLELTEDQQEQVGLIIEEAQDEFYEVRMAYRPKMESIIKSALSRINTLLDPDQQELLKEVEERVLNRWAAPVS